MKLVVSTLRFSTSTFSYNIMQSLLRNQCPAFPKFLFKHKSLGIQLPSEKVVLVGFRGTNTFLEGSWILRDCIPQKKHHTSLKRLVWFLIFVQELLAGGGVQETKAGEEPSINHELWETWLWRVVRVG